MKTKQSAEERDAKRKETHSQIEKKRREKVANCMKELHRLVPSNASQVYLQKLTILENTVEYIKELQDMLGVYKQGQYRELTPPSVYEYGFNRELTPPTPPSIPLNFDIDIPRLKLSNFTDNHYNQ